MKQESLAPRFPGPSLWLSITLLWGSLFYLSSVYLLQLASRQLGGPLFDPSGDDVLRVYGVHAVLLVTFALVAMTARRLMDPEGKSQSQRRDAVKGGAGERIFISLAGSIATGFSFTVLTSLSWWASSDFASAAAALTLPLVLLGSLYNIGAGLSASLLVGLVFLATGTGRKKTA
ncbi:hypothetical protein [Chlorobium sp. N1]|uniref:hypothetical protein n=1 Tax=Chlorobium sp. N1 TaxID=2491138 RepID=UPI00103B0F6F|nr:hypothetical protein [Chlorobium sp. N1]TCD47596.1 hypothetical protein E0L29_07020 [Chlorobium sp. N1]